MKKHNAMTTFSQSTIATTKLQINSEKHIQGIYDSLSQNNQSIFCQTQSINRDWACRNNKIQPGNHKRFSNFKGYQKKTFQEKPQEKIMRILVNAMRKKKCYTFQVLKQFILFSDDSMSSVLSISRFDPLIFADDKIHSLIKILETKSLQNKLWAFLNLKFYRKMQAAKRIIDKVTVIRQKNNKILKKESFQLLKQQLDQKRTYKVQYDQRMNQHSINARQGKKQNLFKKVQKNCFIFHQVECKIQPHLQRVKKMDRPSQSQQLIGTKRQPKEQEYSSNVKKQVQMNISRQETDPHISKIQPKGNIKVHKQIHFYERPLYLYCQSPVSPDYQVEPSNNNNVIKKLNLKMTGYRNNCGGEKCEGKSINETTFTSRPTNTRIKTTMSQNDRQRDLTSTQSLYSKSNELQELQARMQYLQFLRMVARDNEPYQSK